MSAGNRRWPNL